MFNNISAMGRPPPHSVADLAWASKIAEVIADALVAGKALLPEQHNRTIEIAMHSIYKVLAVGDRPDP